MIQSSLTDTVVAALSALEAVYCTAEGVSPSTAWARATGNGNFLSRIAEGRSPRVESVDLAILWFSRHWPDGAVWPKSVQRPSGEDAAA